MRTTSISVPIYFKDISQKGRHSLFAFRRTQDLLFLLNQKVENPSSPLYVKEKMGKARGFDFALSGGVGYSINRKFEILARYDFGLSSVYPDLVESWTGNPNVYRKKISAYLECRGKLHLWRIIKIKIKKQLYFRVAFLLFLNEKISVHLSHQNIFL